MDNYAMSVELHQGECMLHTVKTIGISKAVGDNQRGLILMHQDRLGWEVTGQVETDHEWIYVMIYIGDEQEHTDKDRTKNN